MPASHQGGNLIDGTTEAKVVSNEFIVEGVADDFSVALSDTGTGVVVQAYGDNHLNLLPGGAVEVNNKIITLSIEPDADDSRLLGGYDKRYALIYALSLTDGDNEVSLVDLADVVSKVHTQGTDTTVGTLKSGATQVAAGAVAGELWKTSGHASLPDNVVMVGI